MASEGPIFPTVAGTDATGDTDWTGPGNITATDDVYATAALAAAGTSYDLWGDTFGFSIPSGATVDGIHGTTLGGG